MITMTNQLNRRYRSCDMTGKKNVGPVKLVKIAQ